MDLTAAREVQIAIYQKLTPAQKLEQAANLRELAIKLKFASIKKEQPELSDDDVWNKVKEIFLYATT
jgi:hypothetical protein